MNTDVMFSKKSDNWSTPSDIYDDYMERGWSDPCPLQPDFDGLIIMWDQRNFVNPPYSNIRVWLEKAIAEFEARGTISHFLVPARTDTKWFHELIYGRFRIKFIKGRLKFGDGANSAPFPSM